MIKQVLGALGLLIVYLIFGRPFLRSLNPNRVELNAGETASQDSTGVGGTAGQAPMTQAQALAMAGEQAGFPTLADDPNNPAALMRRKDATYDQKIEMARSLVMEDPARVANVVKHWAGEE